MKDIFLDFIEELRVAGIKADTFQAEAGSGQYEMTLDVSEGLRVNPIFLRLNTMRCKWFAQ